MSHKLSQETKKDIMIKGPIHQEDMTVININIPPWCTPFPLLNQSVFPCLIVASWSAYRFLRRQIWWSVIPISLRIFYSLLWSTQSELTYLYFKIAHNSRRQPISVLYSREALLSRVVIMEIKEKADLGLLRVFLGWLRVLTPNWPWMSLL